MKELFLKAYKKNHNDTIINIPNQVIKKYTQISNDCSICKYNYPDFNENDKFYPSSASYIYDKTNNKHIFIFSSTIFINNSNLFSNVLVSSYSES